MKVLVALALAVSLTACKGSSAEDKKFVAALDNLCRIAGEAKADQSLGDSDRALAIVTRFRDSNPPDAVVKLMQGLANEAPDGRMALLVKAAAEHGASGWSCPALDDVAR